MTQTISGEAEASLMDVRDLAHYLNLSVGAVYQLRHRKEGPPAIRVGGRVRYSRAAVDEWLRDRAE